MAVVTSYLSGNPMGRRRFRDRPDHLAMENPTWGNPGRGVGLVRRSFPRGPRADGAQRQHGNTALPATARSTSLGGDPPVGISHRPRASHRGHLHDDPGSSSSSHPPAASPLIRQVPYGNGNPENSRSRCVGRMVRRNTHGCCLDSGPAFHGTISTQFHQPHFSVEQGHRDLAPRSPHLTGREIHISGTSAPRRHEPKTRLRYTKDVGLLHRKDRSCSRKSNSLLRTIQRAQSLAGRAFGVCSREVTLVRICVRLSRQPQGLRPGQLECRVSAMTARNRHQRRDQ